MILCDGFAMGCKGTDFECGRSRMVNQLNILTSDMDIMKKKHANFETSTNVLLPLHVSEKL